jgi:hypothetical protein
MKRYLTTTAAFLAAVVLLAFPTSTETRDQAPQSSGGLSSTTCPGSGCVSVSTSSLGSFAVQVTGTWSGTITFEGSIDGSTYTTVNAFPLNSSTAVTTTTGNGIWSGGAAGLSIVRARMSSYVSGTANVTIQAARGVVVAGSSGGGGGGGGAPATAEYWVGSADGTLSAEKNLGALATGLVLNTSGTPSAYAGSSCTNQFPRSTNASGAWTCASVALAADVSGDLPFANIAQASGASVLLGRGSASGAGDFQEITLGTTLAMSGTVLSAGSNSRVRTFGITIDGSGSAITTGVKGFIVVPATGTITSAYLLSTDASSTSGSIVIDVWKDTFANYPPTDADSITASAPPTLSSANKSLDSTLTGWTTSVTAGDVIGFNVDSATTVTRVTLVILYTVN